MAYKVKGEMRKVKGLNFLHFTFYISRLAFCYELLYEILLYHLPQIAGVFEHCSL